MRKIKLYVTCSLDQFIADSDGGVDWLIDHEQIAWADFYESIDTVLMGRKTHDFMLKHGETCYKGKVNYVFTRNPNPPEVEGVQFVHEDPADFSARLRESDGKDIWLVGGGELTTALLARELVDEIRLNVQPILLGDGISLWSSFSARQNLSLTKMTGYDNGLVELLYQVDHEAAE